MIKIKKILLPTDFSPCADQALDHALFLAAKNRASLHMLRAIVLHAQDPHSPTAHFIDIAEIHQRLRDLARIEMKTAIRARGASLPSIEMRQRRGFSSAEVILDYASEEDVDLLVMGTHGRRGLGHLLLGSVAEEVVRRAPCPVLTIRERAFPGPADKLRRVLVPVDFSEHATKAVVHAKEIAATYGARIDLLHVVEDPPHPAFYDTVGLTTGAAVRQIEEQARLEMRRLYDGSAGPRTDVRVHVARGRASEEIVRFAESARSDLLVIATHGLTGLRHWLLGSVADSVVRSAPCPVFTVKAFGRSLMADLEPARNTGS